MICGTDQKQQVLIKKICIVKKVGKNQGEKFSRCAISLQFNLEILRHRINLKQKSIN